MARPLVRDERLTMRLPSDLRAELDQATAPGERLTNVAERALRLGLQALREGRGAAAHTEPAPPLLPGGWPELDLSPIEGASWARVWARALRCRKFLRRLAREFSEQDRREDVRQWAILALVESLSELEQGEAVRRYLHGPRKVSRAESMRFHNNKANRAKARMRQYLEAPAPLGPDEADALQPTPTPAPDAHIERAHLGRWLEESLARLPRRHAQVLRLRFLDEQPHTFAEAGEALDLSRERIRQIETQALATLRRLAQKDARAGLCA